jgi:hypothetical protein
MKKRGLYKRHRIIQQCTNLVTNLISLSWVLLEKLIVAQVVKKFLGFNGTMRFFAVFTTCCHCSQLTASDITHLSNNKLYYYYYYYSFYSQIKMLFFSVQAFQLQLRMLLPSLPFVIYVPN